MKIKYHYLKPSNAIINVQSASVQAVFFCGFGAHLEKGKNRYQILKEIDIKKWEYCIGGGEYVNGIWQANNKGLGFAVPLEYVGIKYE